MIDDRMEEFVHRLDEENMRYWAERAIHLKKDLHREHKGLWYLALSLVTIIGGFALFIYGMVAKGYVLKPVVAMAVLSIILGLSIVIGGFGKVSK